MGQLPEKKLSQMCNSNDPNLNNFQNTIHMHGIVQKLSDYFRKPCNKQENQDPFSQITFEV